MQWFQRPSLRKKEEEEATIEDNGPLPEKYPTHWSVLAEKGYQGAAEFCRVIYPKRKAPGAFLSPGEVAENKSTSSDRILVEIFFVACAGFGP